MGNETKRISEGISRRAENASGTDLECLSIIVDERIFQSVSSELASLEPRVSMIIVASELQLAVDYSKISSPFGFFFFCLSSLFGGFVFFLVSDDSNRRTRRISPQRSRRESFAPQSTHRSFHAYHASKAFTGLCECCPEQRYSRILQCHEKTSAGGYATKPEPTRPSNSPNMQSPYRRAVFSAITHHTVTCNPAQRRQQRYELSAKSCRPDIFDDCDFAPGPRSFRADYGQPGGASDRDRNYNQHEREQC